MVSLLSQVAFFIKPKLRMAHEHVSGTIPYNDLNNHFINLHQNHITVVVFFYSIKAVESHYKNRGLFTLAQFLKHFNVHC